MTRPVVRQDSLPDIAHFVSGKFLVCDLDFDMTWCEVGWGWGGVGEGKGGRLQPAKYSSNQR